MTYRIGQTVINVQTEMTGVIRAILGNPRYVQVLCDDDVMRTMDTSNLK